MSGNQPFRLEAALEGTIRRAQTGSNNFGAIGGERTGNGRHRQVTLHNRQGTRSRDEDIFVHVHIAAGCGGHLDGGDPVRLIADIRDGGFVAEVHLHELVPVDQAAVIVLPHGVCGPVIGPGIGAGIDDQVIGGRSVDGDVTVLRLDVVALRHIPAA